MSKILHLKCEDTGLIAFDSSGNGNHGTKVNTDVLGANTFSYEGSDAPEPYMNTVGYSDGDGSNNNGLYIPRDESNPKFDVLGNPLQYKGQVSYSGQLVQSNCLSFDGFDDYVDTNSQLGINSFPFTVVFRAKCKEELSEIISGSDSDFRGIATLVCVNGIIALNYGDGTGNQTSDRKAYNISDAYPIDNKYRTFIIECIDFNTVKCYIEDIGEVLLEYFNGTATQINFNATYKIGTLQTVGRYSSPELLKLQTWTRLLSLQEKLDIVNNKKIDSTGLTLDYNFAEGTGNTVFDASGNNNHGTLINGVSWAKQDIYHYNFENGFKVNRVFGDNDVLTISTKVGSPVLGFASTRRSEVQFDFTILPTNRFPSEFGINLGAAKVEILPTQIIIRTSAGVNNTITIPTALQTNINYFVKIIDDFGNWSVYLDNQLLGQFVDNGNGSVNYIQRVNGKFATGLIVHRLQTIDSVVAEDNNTYLPNKLWQYKSENGIELISNGINSVGSLVPLNHTYPFEFPDYIDTYKPSQRNHNGAETKVDFNPYGAPELSEVPIQGVENEDLSPTLFKRINGNRDYLTYKQVSQANRIFNFINNQLEPETNNYIKKVNLESGIIVDVNYINAVYKKLKVTGLLESMEHFTLSRGGMIKNSNDRISKLFSLNHGDAIQNTELNKPVLGNNTIDYSISENRNLTLETPITTSTDVPYSIVGRIIPNTGNGSSFYNIVGSISGNALNMTYFGAGGNSSPTGKKFFIYDRGNGTYKTSNAFITDNIEYNIALVYETNGVYKLYLNGVLDNTFQTTITSFNYLNFSAIGMFNTAVGRYWVNSIENIQVYKSALTLEQIQVLKNL